MVSINHLFYSNLVNFFRLGWETEHPTECYVSYHFKTSFDLLSITLDTNQK